MVGTPYYLSPEIVQSKPYNVKTDIWSLGVMLYEMCALKPPFDAPSIHLLSMKIVRGVYNPVPTCFSAELRQLIKMMLDVRPEQRPDVNKVLNMPVVQRRIKSYLSESVHQAEFSHTVLHKQNVFAKKPTPALQGGGAPSAAGGVKAPSPRAAAAPTPSAAAGARGVVQIGGQGNRALAEAELKRKDAAARFLNNKP